MKAYLSPEVKRRCWVFAKGVIRSYALDLKPRSKSLARSYNDELPADKNLLVQYAGRLAECGLCQLMEISIETLNWNDKACDKGFDIQCCDLLIDVKSSYHRRATKLIWPLEKNDLLAGSVIDLLAFVPIDMEDGQPDFRGWAWKKTFERKHLVAGKGSGLYPGTWYMHERDLEPPEHFPALPYTPH